MGFFSSKTKIYVSSVTYNLLGDDDPIKYMPSTILNGVLSQEPELGSYVVRSLISGPGSNFKKFMRWSKSSKFIEVIGLATSVFYDSDLANNTIVNSALTAYLNLPENQKAFTQNTYIRDWDFFAFGEEWIYKNRRDQLNTAYKIELIDEIEHKDTSRKLHYWYYRNHTDIVITFIDGSTQRLLVREWGRSREEGIFDRYFYDLKARYLYIKYDLETNTGTPVLPVYKREAQMLIYKQGSGFNQFESLFSSAKPLYNTYAPFIPFRTWNRFLSTEKDKEYLPEVYKMSKKAVKKALGSDKYIELMNAIADNKSINDIDFAYLSFGVPLNMQFDAAKRYIFEFFQNFFLTPQSPKLTRGFFGKYRDKPKQVQIKSNNSDMNYNVWVEWGGLDAGYKPGLCRPYAKPGHYYVYAEERTINDWDYRELEADGSHDHYWDWVRTSETYEIVHVVYQELGNYYDIEVENFCQANLIYGGKSVIISAGDALGFVKRKITSYNLVKGEDGHKYVDTDNPIIREEIITNDPPSKDAELSGLVIPIQYNILNRMSLAKATDLMQCCNNLLFNCYVTKKQRWYQSGFFGILITIIVIVIIVVATIINPALGGGLAAALGGGLGGFITTNVILAAAINIITATVLANLVIKVANKYIGGKLGVIIGVLGAIAVNMYTFGGAAAFTSFNPSSASTWLNVTNAVGKVYVNTLQYDASKIANKIVEINDVYKTKMDEIEAKTAELLNISAYKDILLNALVLQDPTFKFTGEPIDQFLYRTLLLGSDICDLTLNSVHNFTENTLTLST